jgi:polyisoprenoid-binding protein YceI
MSDAFNAMMRTVDGEPVPTPGVFTLDATHSHVAFSIRHMMIAKVRGRFTDVQGTLTIAEDVGQSTVEIVVDLASVDTRDEGRDNHLRSPDFFDVEQFPKMTFRSTGIHVVGGEKFRLDGELDLHGVKGPLSLDVVYEGAALDPWGNQRIGFSATGSINRESHGLTWNAPLETGGLMVGKDAKVEIEAELVRPLGGDAES